jgi:hypothetical protein
MIDPGPTQRKPPETEPATLTQPELNRLTVPNLRDYFLTHWDWYTLCTITQQSTPTQLDEAARPHVLAMTEISKQCARVLMQRFGYSAEKSMAQVETWLDTGYEIPDSD